METQSGWSEFATNCCDVGSNPSKGLDLNILVEFKGI
jgi:hypothetical protein